MTTVVWLLVVFVVIPALFIAWLQAAHHDVECPCGRLENPDNPCGMCDRCVHYASPAGGCPACRRNPYHIEEEP